MPGPVRDDSSASRHRLRAPGADEFGPRFRPPAAVVLFVPVFVSLLVQVPGTIALAWWQHVPVAAAGASLTLAAASALVLLAARRLPGPTVAAVAALSAVDLLIAPVGGPPPVALIFAIVGAVVRGARVWALVSVGVAWLGVVVGADFVGVEWHPARIAFATVGLALCFVVGEGIRARIRGAQERRTQLVARRRAAEQEERTRIARELHDVLAHSLSQIAVQSGVGLHLFDREPERAREALANIRSLSATGLDEVRGVLAFLRGDEIGAPDTAPLTPQPQLAQLPSLVAGRTGLGLSVALDDRLAGDTPPSAVQTTAYRIAQEALTNVVRHSAASHATVTVEHDADDLVLTVADDGAGIPATASERGGLRGMRERAELAGGALTVDSGTRGTAVVARLPWRGAA
ncbi:signal transduction histidine kinase [Microbacterium trichothecenolyticum]|uniref:sensor histidine kinase n=1 Tax=Microbacterium trichothecenolyticum TaxID=69370 RepID=UPI00285E19F5|nr:sensor histidine kinase [Microbacterium trichothecenolyticum]MDR7185862.1 signal transduction histidine kinase [Microbacterium trichothecenolyticum]